MKKNQLIERAANPNYHDVTICEVTPDGSKYWDIRFNEEGETSCHTGFGMRRVDGTPEPKVGDTLRLYYRDYVGFGGQIRGVDLHGQPVYYRTSKELEQEHQQWLKKEAGRKERTFAKSRKKLDAQYEALPDVFKARLNKFRNTNPNFRVEYEGYEMLCCTQAVAFAEALKTPEALKAWNELPYDEQKASMPAMDDGHSGNTLGMAVRLAYLYLTNPQAVTTEHGALTPLVGCEKYGCPHTDVEAA